MFNSVITKTFDEARPCVFYKAHTSNPYTPQSHPCSRQGATWDSANKCLPVGVEEHYWLKTTQQPGKWFILKYTPKMPSPLITWLESPVRPKHCISVGRTGKKLDSTDH